LLLLLLVRLLLLLLLLLLVLCNEAVPHFQGRAVAAAGCWEQEVAGGVPGLVIL
jgi:hypothetical protein